MDESSYVSICKHPKRNCAEMVAQKGRGALVSVHRGNNLIGHFKIKFERCGPSNPESFCDYISNPQPLLVSISHSLSKQETDCISGNKLAKNTKIFVEIGGIRCWGVLSQL